ncbi:MAG: hypothetical protein AB9869_18890 [Verrucomicrobiia bacterium]
MLDLQTYGDFALETGKYVQVDKDGKTTGEGKYLAVWRRDIGDWKIYCETWNVKQESAQ